MRLSLLTPPVYSALCAEGYTYLLPNAEVRSAGAGTCALYDAIKGDAGNNSKAIRLDEQVLLWGDSRAGQPRIYISR